MNNVLQIFAGVFFIFFAIFYAVGWIESPFGGNQVWVVSIITFVIGTALVGRNLWLHVRQ
ncbi:MAG: hypothetical protein R3B53_03195 [Candidatus Paceibacterota bacterium]